MPLPGSHLTRANTTVTNPWLAVFEDPDTGIHSPAANDIALVQAGAYVIRGDGTDTKLYVGATLVADFTATNIKFYGGSTKVGDYTSARRMVHYVPLLLTGLTATSGVVASYLNPESSALLVVNRFLDLRTVATAACTLDIGTAANATTGSDNLIDGIDVNAATGYLTANGSNGNAYARMTASTGCLNVQVKTGNVTGLVGTFWFGYVIE